MQRKAGIAKLFCRVCNLTFQKKLCVLDKEVDVYCSWIDQANQVNKKGQIGLIGGSDDEDDAPKKVVPRRKTVVARDISDSDEEYKELPRASKREDEGADIAAKYSATDKIAELGIGASDSKKIKTEESPEDESNPEDLPSKEPVESKIAAKPAPVDDGNDSDDLF